MWKGRVALVSDWFAPRAGGIEHHLQDLAVHLSARGLDVHVVTTTPGEPWFRNVPVHRVDLPMIPGWDVAVPNLLRIPFVGRILSGIGADVVHAHGFFSVLANGSAIACRHLGVPCLLTNHSMLPPGRSLNGARMVYVLFTRAATRLSAVSEAAAADTTRATGRTLVPVLPNGIDPGWWEQRRTSGDDLHILSVMRLTRTKSPELLIEALPRVVAALQGRRRLRVTIVGDGPRRRRVEDLARRIGVAKHLRFEGHVDREAVRTLLATADVFALPSRQEAFGIAVLEARCAGVPVVAMKVGGVADIVGHGRHGLLADGPDEFARDLARLAVDGSLRERLSGSSTRDLERFSWDNVVHAHVNAYEELLAAAPLPRGTRGVA